MTKKRMFSGVQPTGNLTIGNYLGAISNFSKLQDEYECIYSVVDMHSITIPQIPAELRKKTRSILAMYLATGLDPEKSILFIQSHVPEHVELSWVLSSISYMGQLSRMTQYKEKSVKSTENLNAGLFTYPVLMAADILLYKADLVPVGEDQRQHLELARDLAIRFNHKYSDTFTVPDAMIPKEAGKIMSLKNAASKMSKSDLDSNASIYIMDDKDTIIRKIKKATTDSLNRFSYTKEQPELRNLINIYQGFSTMSVEEIVKKYENENYSRFKEELGELIAISLIPVQKRYDEIYHDDEYIHQVAEMGRERARTIASKMIRKVYKKVGFYQL